MHSPWTPGGAQSAAVVGIEGRTVLTGSLLTKKLAKHESDSTHALDEAQREHCAPGELPGGVEQPKEKDSSVTQ